MGFASFAHKVFEVNTDKIHTYSDLQFSSTLETEKQDSEGRKPSTYIKGAGLNNFSIKIKLDVAQGVNPDNEIDSWIALKDSSQPDYFIKKGRPLANCLWLLLDVQVSEDVSDNLGNTLSATITLKFEEYVRPGKPKDEESSSKGTTKPKSTQSVYYALSPSGK